MRSLIYYLGIFKLIIINFLLEIPDFLSAEECEHIIKLAGKAGLSESTTLPDIEDETGEMMTISER